VATRWARTRPTSRTGATGSTILAVGTAFFRAELGDKTMLATITLATKEPPLGVWLGSTVGMVAADAIAIAVGRILGTRLPERWIRYGAAAAFVIFGVILVLQGLGVLGG
jgi:putative Ca2+/H+ antiporter (TMEM165/GDT1 family)